MIFSNIHTFISLNECTRNAVRHVNESSVQFIQVEEVPDAARVSDQTATRDVDVSSQNGRQESGYIVVVVVVVVVVIVAALLLLLLLRHDSCPAVTASAVSAVSAVSAAQSEERKVRIRVIGGVAVGGRRVEVRAVRVEEVVDAHQSNQEAQRNE